MITINENELALAKAIQNQGDSSEITSIIERGYVNVNYCEDRSKRSLLLMAAECNRIDIMESLVEAGADKNHVDAEGRNAVHVAVYHNEPDMINFLNDKGVDLNRVRKDGLSPIWLAASRGFCNAIDALCDCGVDVNVRGKQNRTPLFAAAANDKIEAIELLLDRGADINALDSARQTPLFAAASNDKYNAIKCLAEQGADLNVQNKFGQTALHMALQENRNQAVEKLICYGAKLDIVDNRGRSPFDMVYESNMNLDRLRLLCAQGAAQNFLEKNPSFFENEHINQQFRDIIAEGVAEFEVKKKNEMVIKGKVSEILFSQIDKVMPPIVEGGKQRNLGEDIARTIGSFIDDGIGNIAEVFQSCSSSEYIRTTELLREFQEQTFEKIKNTELDVTYKFKKDFLEGMYERTDPSKYVKTKKIEQLGQVGQVEQGSLKNCCIIS